MKDIPFRVATILHHQGHEGPGYRTTIWTAGCTIRCNGCINSHLFDGERFPARPADEIVDHICRGMALGDVGISVVGGESFDQPAALAMLVREVAELSQLLRDPHCRLLTLVGPGGIGKTRLAIEAASHLQAVLADGVYFVPLAPANSARFIVPVIADAIGFAFQSAGPAEPKTHLLSYLKEKQTLLLTDNLEHLLAEPGIELLAELLANAPHVKLLVTSRESVELQGEWVFEVQGLPVPESQNAEGSAQNASVELFLQRARRAHAGFNAMPEDYPAIVRICQLVDGNPLGIELAAAWVRTLLCDEIERGLGS